MKIKILGESYSITQVDVIENDENIMGQIDHMNNIIYLKLGLTKDKKNVTLIHEILHAIFEQLGFDDEHDNEHLIKALAESIYQVFMDNQLF